MATIIYPIPHALPHCDMDTPLTEWWGSMFCSLEPEWTFVTTQPAHYSKSKAMSLSRVDHKTSMHCCLFSWSTHLKTSHPAMRKPQKPQGQDTCRYSDQQVMSQPMSNVNCQTCEWSESSGDYSPLLLNHPQPLKHSSWCCMEEITVHEQINHCYLRHSFEG